MNDNQFTSAISWRRSIQIAFLFWTFTSLITMFIYSGFRLSMYPDVLKISLLWYFNFSVKGLLLYWLTHKVPFEKYSRLVFFIIHLLTGTAMSAAGTALAFLDLYIFPFQPMQNYLDEMYMQYFHIGLISYAAAVFFFYFIHYLRRSREQAINAAYHKQLSQEAELKALKAQINPHFLFNALNSINSLVVKEPLKAREMVISLSSTLRYVLDTSESDWVTVKEEINFAKAYSAIEKIRFGDKLHIEYDVEQTLENKKIPPVIIQPLVENAIKHGINQKPGGGSVKVDVFSETDRLICRIGDTGVGLPISSSQAVSPESDRENPGLGLKNIRERLKAIYGPDFALTIENNHPNGCIATISLRLDEESLS